MKVEKTETYKVLIADDTKVLTTYKEGDESISFGKKIVCKLDADEKIYSEMDELKANSIKKQFEDAKQAEYEAAKKAKEEARIKTKEERKTKKSNNED